MEFHEAYVATKDTMTGAIFDALPQVYISGFSMITSGVPSRVLAGVLILLGITAMIISGFWKLLVKVTGRSFLN